MPPCIQVMILPPQQAGQQPPFLLEDDGIWRDTVAADNPDPLHITADSLRQDAERELEQAMQAVDADQAYDPTQPAFRSRFHKIYRQLVSADVRSVLDAAGPDPVTKEPPVLKVYFSRGNEWIPWELLHDGNTFLGLKFVIARMPILRQPNAARGERRRAVSQVFDLVGNSLFSNGDYTKWYDQFAGLAPAIQINRVPSALNAATPFPTVDDLSQAATTADVIHVTCHGGLSDENTAEFFWTLDHQNKATYNYRITSSIAETLPFQRRPLVFGNACASAAGGGGKRGHLFGFGGDFMKAGALNFIGTIAPISKEIALNFAPRFYAELLGNGNTIGSSLLAAKKHFHNQVPRKDPSYLFYSLYGPPETSYEVGP